MNEKSSSKKVKKNFPVLIIDTTKAECQVAILLNEKTFEKKWQWQKDTGSEALKNFEALLKNLKLKIENIRAILVNCGPGSFTGTRVGVTLANALAFANDISVFGFKDGELDEQMKKITKTENFKFSKIALPYYF